MTAYYLTFAVIAAAFYLIWRNFVDLKAHDEGSALMIERAAIIRSGQKRSSGVRIGRLRS